MFSGKSTELLRRVNRFVISKHKCLLVKYINDTRYDHEKIMTHDRYTYDISSIKTDKLKSIADVIRDYDIIGIDEGQFYEDISLANEFANAGKIIIIAALDCTYDMKPFHNIINIVHLAEKVIKLSAICMVCYEDCASYTKRIIEDDALELIGGTDKYISICRKCLK
ncbi:unnamed protein product [Sphagnum jensenii]